MYHCIVQPQDFERKVISMTTKIRMFGKKLLKVMSIILATCMLISLTACGSASQQDAQPTPQYATVDPVSDVPEDPAGEPDDGYWHEEEPSSTEEPSTNEEPAINPPTGTYTYNVYGYTISMDVDLNKYIYDNDGSQWFDLIPMIYDLGWAGADTYTVADWNDHDTVAATWFTYHSGDMTTRIDLGMYNEEQVTGTNGYQFRSINVRYLNNSNKSYYSNPEITSTDSMCYFGKHYSDCEYRLSGQGWYASYEDIVMIAYTFWAASENPGNNPYAPVFGTSGSYVTSSTSQAVEYSFP